MNRWLDAFIPKANEPIPGVPDWEFDQIKVPTLIVREGKRTTTIRNGLRWRSTA